MRLPIHDLMALSIDELAGLAGVQENTQNAGITPSDWVSKPDGAPLAAGGVAQAPEDMVVDVPVTSLAQERLWFMDRLVPANPFYNIPFGLRIRGTLQHDVFAAAWEAVLERHPPLRSRFIECEQGPPRVEYLDAARIHLVVTGPDAATRLPQLLEREAKVGFDLEKGPPIRGMLIPEGDSSHIFLFTVHHIVFDGWSIRVFLDDLFTATAAIAQGTLPQWQPLAASYEQFAVWQRQEVARVAQDEATWWRETLANLPDLELPTDGARPEIQTFRGGLHECTLPRATAASIDRLAREEGTTPFVVWLAVYALTLSRKAGQEDFAVGSSLAARSHPSLEPLVGFFVENLCIRIRVAPDVSFRDFVRQVAATVLDAIGHAVLPFQMITEALGRKRDLARNPLYQTAFTYQSMPEGESISGGLQCDSLSVPLHSTHMDLEVLAWPRDNGLHCHFMYSCDLFSPETIASMAEGFMALAEAATVSPDTPVNTLGLEAVPSFRVGPRRAFVTLSPYTLYAARSHETPEATALVHTGYGAGTTRVTRAALLSLADGVAAGLAASGVRQGDAVGLHLAQGPGLLSAILGVWKLGAVWVPLIPKSPPAVMGWMLIDAGARHVVTEMETWAEKLRQAHATGEQGLDRVIPFYIDTYAPGGHSPASSGPHSVDTGNATRQGAGEAPVTETDIACILYTSGSTGRPKGVGISHGALANRLQWMWECFPWQDGEVACQKTSPAFVDFLWECFGPLLQGIPLVIVQSDRATDIAWFLDVLERERVTRLVLVPSLLTAMLDNGTGFTGRLPALRHLTSSGEPLSPALAAAALKALPAARLFNIYGSTEVTADAVWHEVTANESSDGIPIGLPINNTYVALVDGAGAVLPRGAVGELLVGGACLAAGYQGAAADNGTAFTTRSLQFFRGDGEPPETCATGRWFATGDLARMDAEGRLILLGRKDRQLKVRGIRVEPEEVQTILERHPRVREARVVGVRTPHHDEGGTGSRAGEETRLVAYLVPEPAQHEGHEKGREACVRQWETLYDSLYAAVRGQGDILDNYFIWQSSYTGSAIPQGEMREWLRLSLEGIRRHAPRRVLEVGCGQGFLLMGLAPECERYVGIDVSGEALACLRQLLAEHPGMTGDAIVELVQAEATSLPPLPEGAFDTAVYNSIIQYFPDSNHLLRALGQALPLMTEGGHIFCGDIRNHDTFSEFHTAVQLHACDDTTPVRRFMDNVTAGMRREGELLVAPALWHNLHRLSGRFVHAEVRPKTGYSDNELFQFRYDVSLYLDGLPGRPFSGTTLRWDGTDGPDNSEALHTLLSSPSGRRAAFEGGLAVTDIPDARIARFQRLHALCVDKSTIAPETPLGDLKRAVDERLAARPADRGMTAPDIIKIAKANGLSAEVFLSPTDGTTLHVLFMPEGAAPVTYTPALLKRRRLDARDAHTLKAAPFAPFVNATSRNREDAGLRAQVREFAASNLPAHAVPDVLLTLDEWPRTPSGKIDWMRLPSPNVRMFAGTAVMQRASHATEKMLVEIWKLVIGIDDVSVHDVFFEIGGTSLLLAQVHQMLQQRLHREIPLTELFRNPTVHSLAAWLSQQEQTAKDMAAGSGITGTARAVRRNAATIRANRTSCAHEGVK